MGNNYKEFIKYYEELDLEELEQIGVNDDSKPLLELLEKEEDFEAEIDKILSNIQDLDLTKLQSQILLYLKNLLSRIEKKLNIEVTCSIPRSRIENHLKQLSLYLMNTRSMEVRDASRGIAVGKSKYEYLNKEARAEVRILIKKFAIYELYKILNPRRIAGNTRYENFVNNVIMMGLEVARKYEGGTNKELQKYSPEFIKELERSHIKFKKTGGRGIF